MDPRGPITVLNPEQDLPGEPRAVHQDKIEVPLKRQVTPTVKAARLAARGGGAGHAAVDPAAEMDHFYLPAALPRMPVFPMAATSRVPRRQAEAAIGPTVELQEVTATPVE